MAGPAAKCTLRSSASAKLRERIYLLYKDFHSFLLYPLSPILLGTDGSWRGYLRMMLCNRIKSENK